MAGVQHSSCWLSFVTVLVCLLLRPGLIAAGAGQRRALTGRQAHGQAVHSRLPGQHVLPRSLSQLSPALEGQVKAGDFPATRVPAAGRSGQDNNDSVAARRELLADNKGFVVVWGDANTNPWLSVPIPSVLLTGRIIKVAAGWNHALALTDTGEVVIWGNNDVGQLGRPAALQQGGVVDIAGGGGHSLAVLGDGTVVGWGLNDEGQASPPSSLQGKKVIQVACGTWHSLALLADGTVVAWGSNAYGERVVPAELQTLAASIAAGDFISMAVLVDGRVIQWGKGSFIPPAVGARGAKQVAPGTNQVAGLLRDGTVLVWAQKPSQDTPPDQNAMDQLLNEPQTASSQAAAVSASDSHSMVLHNWGQVEVWGSASDSVLQVPVEAKSGVVAIAAGDDFSIALISGKPKPSPKQRSPKPPPSPPPLPSPLPPSPAPLPSPIPPPLQLQPTTQEPTPQVPAPQPYQQPDATLPASPLPSPPSTPSPSPSPVWTVTPDMLHAAPGCGAVSAQYGYACNRALPELPGSWQLSYTVTSSPMPPNNLCTGGFQDTMPGLQLPPGATHWVHFMLSSTATGWIAMAYPDVLRHMYPAKTILGFVDPAMGTAFIHTYQLESDYLPTPDLTSWASNMGAAFTPDGRTTICFSQLASVIALNGNSIGSRRSLLGDSGVLDLTQDLKINLASSLSVATTIMHNVQGGVAIDITGKDGVDPEAGVSAFTPVPGSTGSGQAATGAPQQPGASTNSDVSTASSPGISTGSLIGIVVGSVVALSVIVVALVFWVMRRPSKATTSPAKQRFTRRSASSYAVPSVKHPGPLSLDLDEEQYACSNDVVTVLKNGRATIDEPLSPARTTTVGNASSMTAAMNGCPWQHVAPTAASLTGLAQGDVFLKATADQYGWTSSMYQPDFMQQVQAGLNDVQLDAMVPKHVVGAAATSAACRVVQLTRQELQQQVLLLTDGLVTEGPGSVTFKCVWPGRFGHNALLAAKVLKDGFESTLMMVESFKFEAAVLSAARHPNLVRLYGYCVEPPSVCLVLELLPHSLADVLYKGVPLLSPAAAQCPATVHISMASASSAGMSALSAQCMCACMPHTNRRGNTAKTSALAAATVATTATPPKRGSAGGVCVIDTQAITAPPTLATSSRTDDTGDEGCHVQGLMCGQVLRISADVAAGLAYLHSQPLPVFEGTAGEQAGGTLQRQRSGFSETASAAFSGISAYALSEAFSAYALQDLDSRNRRVVHRGLRPSTISFNAHGVAKICDIGFGKQHQDPGAMTALPYLAPELLAAVSAGVPEKRVTNRVDIYSLAMVMWEMLAGHVPWRGMQEPAILQVVLKRTRPSLPYGPGEADVEGKHSLVQQPASLSAMNELNDIIRACWNHQVMCRPAAGEVHRMVSELLQQMGDYTMEETDAQLVS